MKVKPKPLGEALLRELLLEGLPFLFQLRDQPAQLLEPFLGIREPRLCRLELLLHAASEVVLDVVLGILEAPLEGYPHIGARAQALDDLDDFRQGLPFLLFGGLDVLRDELDLDVAVLLIPVALLKDFPGRALRRLDEVVG